MIEGIYDSGEPYLVSRVLASMCWETVQMEPAWKTALNEACARRGITYGTRDEAWTQFMRDTFDLRPIVFEHENLDRRYERLPNGAFVTRRRYAINSAEAP